MARRNHGGKLVLQLLKLSINTPLAVADVAGATRPEGRIFNALCPTLAFGVHYNPLNPRWQNFAAISQIRTRCNQPKANTAGYKSDDRPKA